MVTCAPATSRLEGTLQYYVMRRTCWWQAYEWSSQPGVLPARPDFKRSFRVIFGRSSALASLKKGLPAAFIFKFKTPSNPTSPPLSPPSVLLLFAFTWFSDVCYSSAHDYRLGQAGRSRPDGRLERTSEVVWPQSLQQICESHILRME
jgi:hypothetical protein